MVQKRVGVAARTQSEELGGGKRDLAGRWLPGHAPRSPGRPKGNSRAILKAINAVLTPEVTEESLRWALAMAKELRSPKAVLAILEFAASYQIGKPVAKSITTHAPWEALMYREDDTRTVDSDVVDAKDD